MEKIILFADDYADWRNAMLMFFEMRFPDYDVETFENGTSLDERLNQGDLENVCMVITDNQMPGIEGSEIIRIYASKFPEIPFILYYGGDEEIGEEAVRNRACAYVLKPISLKKFYPIIRDALSKREGVIEEHSWLYKYI